MQKNISLKKYNTFKTGGRAKYFCVIENKKDIIGAIETVNKLKRPFFILGAGSNLLVSDEGFPGIVIKIQNTEYKISNTKIFAGAGIKLGELLSISLTNNLSGLEWASGIPGTLGGAIYGNAGAFDGSMADLVRRVEFFDVKTKKIKFLTNKNCQFKYRESIFKYKKNWVILSVELLFKKAEKKSIKERAEEFLELRRGSQPLNFPSAGSVFKNPCSVGRQAKDFFAAELIEKCGLKGKKIGGAKISEKHANFIINLGGASSEDVIKLIDLIKKSVKNKFGINLEEEIEILSYAHLTNSLEMKK